MLILENSCLFITEGQFTSTPANQEVCVGADVTLDWRFDHENDLHNVKWFRNGFNLIMYMYPPQPAQPADGVTNIQHLTNGMIWIQSVSLQDDGQYICSINYKLSAGLPTVRGSFVNVTILGMSISVFAILPD